jgi:DNA repair exonuclease SbcCD ATPase subunit
MSCAVCQNEISTETYQKNDTDKIDTEDSSCLRLQCGHAFHATCVMQTFRNGFGCPICRESLTTEEEPQMFALIEEDPAIERMDQERNNLRCNHKEIKKYRKLLKEATKQYKILCESLRAKRAALIREALKDFKKKEMRSYKKIKQEVSKHLSKVKKLELDELKKENSQADFDNYSSIAMEFDYDLREHLRCLDYNAADPLYIKFWRG